MYLDKNMELTNKRILVIAPHTDDGEFGCGGTISRAIEQGCRVKYAAFSAAEASLPKGAADDTLRIEAQVATKQLGIPADDLVIYGYSVRRFGEYRQQILDDMLGLRRDFDPHLVFLPSRHDTHQDHQVISAEGFRAFKGISILGYELPWNNVTFDTAIFNVLSSRHVAAKISALRCYESQRMRPYSAPEFIQSLARVRGTQVGVEFAEVFECIRIVLPLNSSTIC